MPIPPLPWKWEIKKGKENRKKEVQKRVNGVKVMRGKGCEETERCGTLVEIFHDCVAYDTGKNIVRVTAHARCR